MHSHFGENMPTLNHNPSLLIDRSIEIPSIPMVLTKIIQALDDDSISARQLEELILHDPSLSARILKLANSAFYSFRTEVKTLSHAIALLGLGLVKSLAIGVTIFESFTKGMKSETNLINKLWMHSFGAGMLTQEIWNKRAQNRKEAELAFLCGLLHDIGKVVFFKKAPMHYSTLFSQEKPAGEPDLCSLEVDIFGMDHAHVGAVLAEKWGFPQELIKTIQFHHSPLDTDLKLVAAISLADQIARQTPIGFDGDISDCLSSEDIQAKLAMPSEEYQQLAALAENKSQEIKKFFERIQ